MAKADARRVVGAVATGLSRRGGRPLGAGERRDVRWALTLQPDTHTHAVDVHGVYVVYRHEGRHDPKEQPTRQHKGEADKAMDVADKPKRAQRKESEARKAKKEERFQAKLWMWKLLEVLPIVGEFATAGGGAAA